MNFVEMRSDFDTFLVSLCFDEFLFEDDLLLFEVFDLFDGCDLLDSHVVDLNTVMERFFLDMKETRLTRIFCAVCNFVEILQLEVEFVFTVLHITQHLVQVGLHCALLPVDVLEIVDFLFQ